MTTSTDTHREEWHVRRQRPDARTTLLSFIDANADRMTFRQFLDRLESSEAFRELFMSALLDCGVKAFAWETPSFNRAMLGDELECALIEGPPPKKPKLDPAKLAPSLVSEEERLVVAIPSPEGDATLIAPCPREASGWYAELGIFLRRVRRAQTHALWQELARAAKATLKTSDKVWLRSSAPGAPWLHLRVDTTPQHVVTKRYAR